MTTHSISVPDDWLVQTVHGRYKETTFEFQFENTASADLYIRLLGQCSSEYEAVYSIDVVIDDGQEHSVTVENPVALSRLVRRQGAPSPQIGTSCIRLLDTFFIFDISG